MKHIEEITRGKSGGSVTIQIVSGDDSCKFETWFLRELESVRVLSNPSSFSCLVLGDRENREHTYLIYGDRTLNAANNLMLDFEQIRASHSRGWIEQGEIVELCKRLASH